MSKCIRKVRGFQILHHLASLASSLNCLIKTCQIELNHMWGCLSFHVKYGTPLNFALHQPSCHVIMHHIAHCTCIDLCYISLVCAFGSSRVEPEYEQFEQEYEHPQEDRACASTADLTGEPTSSPILQFLALLIYCYPYVAILWCHVSYPTCYLYIRDTPPRPTCCLLFASFASRRRV